MLNPITKMYCIVLFCVFVCIYVYVYCINRLIWHIDGYRFMSVRPSGGTTRVPPNAVSQHSRLCDNLSSCVSNYSVQCVWTVKHNIRISVIGPSVLVCILIEHKQMHQNVRFIVMSSQTLLHVSVYQRHYQVAHIILTSCLHVGVHYSNNNAHLRPCSATVHYSQRQLAITTSWVRVPMVSLEFFIDIIIPVTFWPWGWLTL
jgi:hypothetical protein